jgi:peptidoglycan/LPS O-acetylase OafA/YrhL
MLKWDDAAKWLIIEGLIPLFGAGVLFLVLGVFLYVATQDKSRFSYTWSGFFDPLGWLYGATILAVQAGVKSSHSPENLTLTFLCFAAGAICLLLLVAAMFLRGGNKTYDPPVTLKVVTVLFVIVILAAGYNVNAGKAAGGVNEHKSSGSP